MITAIKKWGNSQGLRFPKEMLDQLEISVDDEVNIEIENHKIVITKAYPKKVDLKELFKDYTGSYKGEEFDWGPSVGKEEW